MSLAFEVGQELLIEGTSYRIAEHPAAPGIPHGQEGRQAIVYRVVTEGGDARALKVFKPHYRSPALVAQAERIAPYAALPGLQVCRRTVLTPQRHQALLRQYPDLAYAVLMPWIEGATWCEVLTGGWTLTPTKSLALARSLAKVLAVMERRGLAHCDLSGANVMLPEWGDFDRRAPAGTEDVDIVLVDVEQMYGPGMERPEKLPGASPGYAHRSASDGLWGEWADRFAGAVLMGEMLGWCDEQVRQAAGEGESYFNPDEMQQETTRYRLLIQVLEARWGHDVAAAFEQAWFSDTPATCPSPAAWTEILSVAGPGVGEPRSDRKTKPPSMVSKKPPAPPPPPEEEAGEGSMLWEELGRFETVIRTTVKRLDHEAAALEQQRQALADREADLRRRKQALAEVEQQLEEARHLLETHRYREAQQSLERLTTMLAGSEVSDIPSEEPEAPVQARLVAQEGPAAGREFLLQEVMTIGRARENDIVLNDLAVSRWHAKIKREGGAFFIYDLGATNPIRVNGQEVDHHPLTDGDRVEIGRSLLIFKLG